MLRVSARLWVGRASLPRSVGHDAIRFVASTQDGVQGDGLQHVAVVGAGPAGFYTTKYLLKAHPSVKVDVIEALPTPFGAQGVRGWRVPERAGQSPTGRVLLAQASCASAWRPTTPR